MKFLVIGGSGFVGANLVRRLVTDRHEVVVMDSLDPHLHSTTEHLKPVWNEIEFVRGDMRDESALARCVQGQDVIVNCAAQTSHPLSIQFPLLDAEINCLGNLKLLETVRLVNKSARVVYTSSSTVIGKAINEVVDEDHGERPLDIYSANKGVAEKYYRIYHTVHDLQTSVVRFGNLFGPYGKGYSVFGFVNYFISLAWSNQPITVYGTGSQMRNVTFIDDAVDAILLAATEPKMIGECCFATSENHRSVGEIAHAIVDVLGRGRVEHIDWPEERKRMEIENVRFSSARFAGLTGWRARHTLESGLEATRRALESSGELVTV